MTTTPGQSALRLILLLLISTLLFSCGGGENHTQEGNGAGIAFRLKWPVAKSVGLAASDIPPEVITVRMTVSGPGMESVSADFVASARTGFIANVPIGDNRTITFQGLDSGVPPLVIYQAVVLNVKLVQGINTLEPVTLEKVTPPAAPTGLTAAATSFSQINLVWVDNAKYETGYKIERKTGLDGIYAQIGTAAVSATSYNDLTPSASTVYYYKVRATSDVGDSGYSNEATATTPVQTYSVSGTITNGGSALADVTVTLAGSSSSAATTDIGGKYSFSGLQDGSYTLTPGKTDYTFDPPTLAVTVNGANLSAKNFVATAVPIVPSGLKATAASSNLINLEWNNANKTFSYEIERTDGSSGIVTKITVDTNVTTKMDAGLSADTPYSYRVRATVGVEKSEYCAAVNARTKVTGSAITPLLVNVGTFSIGKYEVTQREWIAVMGSNPSTFTACGLDCPVETVSWDDAMNFIATLNGMSGISYRLPTEEEWQYAAKSGGKDQLYSGVIDPKDSLLNVETVAWYSGNSAGSTHIVGQKKGNGLEIYDMSGNVWEWVSDLSGLNRISLGGSWYNAADLVTTTARISTSLRTTKVKVGGFRLAITNP